MRFDNFLEDFSTELEGYFDKNKLINTLNKMYQFKRVFDSVEEVDNEIFKAQEYYKTLCGLIKEIGISKNDEVSEMKYKINDKLKSIMVSGTKEDGVLKKTFGTATERKEYQKLIANELNVDLYRLENDYDVILNFLNEQMWMMKSYLKSLEDRRIHNVSMLKLTK